MLFFHFFSQGCTDIAEMPRFRTVARHGLFAGLISQKKPVFRRMLRHPFTARRIAEAVSDRAATRSQVYRPTGLMFARAGTGALAVCDRLPMGTDLTVI